MVDTNLKRSEGLDMCTHCADLQAKLAVSEEQYRLLSETMREVIWIIDAETLNFLFVSPSVQRLWGYTAEEVMANPIDAALTPESAARVRILIQERTEAFRSGKLTPDAFFSAELEQPCKDGSTIWTEAITSYYKNPQSGRIEIKGVSRDISVRRKAEAALREKTEELHRYFSMALDLFCIADMEGFFLKLNKQWSTTLGYSLDELEGKRFLDFVHRDDLDSTLQAVAQLGDQKEVLNFINRYRCKDGTYRWIEWRSYPCGNRIYAAARDITDRKKLEEELQQQATTDELTGIANRRSFFKRAEEELRRIDRYQRNCALLFLDIDHFKKVNDTYGHAVGDKALQRIAAICQESMRSTDLLGRIGGEEFAMLLLETGLMEAGLAAERLRQSIQDAVFLIDGNIVPLKVSIGVTGHGPQEASLSEMMILADQALYQAKQSGRNRVMVLEAGDAKR